MVKNRNAHRKAGAARLKAPIQDELPDLATDPAETSDVHNAHPEVVARLRKLLAEARDRGHTR